MMWSRQFRYFRKHSRSEDGSIRSFRAVTEEYEHFNRNEKWKPQNYHPKSKHKGNHWKEKEN